MREGREGRGGREGGREGREGVWEEGGVEVGMVEGVEGGRGKGGRSKID